MKAIRFWQIILLLRFLVYTLKVRNALRVILIDLRAFGKLEGEQHDQRLPNCRV